MKSSLTLNQIDPECGGNSIIGDVVVVVEELDVELLLLLMNDEFVEFVEIIMIVELRVKFTDGVIVMMMIVVSHSNPI